MTKRLHQRSLSLLAALTLSACALTLAAPDRADALPQPCQTYCCRYYSDPGYTQQVGAKTVTCSGQVYSGGNTSTRYYLCGPELCL